MTNPQAQTAVPRWRGFNLLDMFTTRSQGQWQEQQFGWIADWGFDFVRLPLCYTLWTRGDDVYAIDEQGLARLDRAMELGARYGLHVCLNFHRGPGYSVNGERAEPFNLWKDQPALDAFIFHWELMARRYRGIDSRRLSFNLINEPAGPNPKTMTRPDHERVIRATVASIRRIDPDRLIILDGLDYGNTPLGELADLPNVAQSCRAYAPFGLTHYKAPWVKGEGFPCPTWPGRDRSLGPKWDRDKLQEFYQPWIDLARQGVGVHCGEGGAWKCTPHDVMLRWLEDVLDILTAHNIGFALWNFTGGFGVLDSQREDVEYEDFNGHRLDRRLLQLLKRH